MKHQTWIFSLILGITLFAAASEGSGLVGGPYAIAPLDVNGGGTRSTGGAYVITASIAQTGGVGTSAGGVYRAEDGMWPAALVAPALIASDPPADGTLAKIASNVVLLTFDLPLALPSPAEVPLKIQPLSGGPDLGSEFICSVDPDGVTLRAKENADVLADRTWYRITPADGFDVEMFEVDVCTLWGDANGSGRVTPADSGALKPYIDQRTDERWDLNGTGRVTDRDYGIAREHLGHRKPSKPQP